MLQAVGKCFLKSDGLLQPVTCCSGILKKDESLLALESRATAEW